MLGVQTLVAENKLYSFFIFDKHFPITLSEVPYIGEESINVPP